MRMSDPGWVPFLPATGTVYEAFRLVIVSSSCAWHVRCAVAAAPAPPSTASPAVSEDVGFLRGATAKAARACTRRPRSLMCAAGCRRAATYV